MAHVTCRFCGSSFETNRSSRVLCDSPDCRRAYIREAMRKYRASQARPSRPCRQCGVEILEPYGNTQFCSYDCSRTHHLRKRRDTEYQPALRTCDFCTGPIPYKSGKRRYCSAECQKAGIAREARWRIKGLPPGTPVSEVCELCGAADRPLKIDHDHSCCPKSNACGKCFRGMLCHPCNVALGMFHESPVELRRAAEYLEGTYRWIGA